MQLRKRSFTGVHRFTELLIDVAVDDVPPRGAAGGIRGRALRHCRADQRATAGRLMRGSSLNWPTLSSVM